MLPTRLILIRHGHTDRGRPARLVGWTDVPLSALGLEQATRLCARLAAEDRPDALYVSSLQRARATARPLAEALGVEPRPCAAIREIGCGLVDGWPLAAVERSYPDLLRTNARQANDSFRWPWGESYQGFRDRVVAAVRDMAHAHPGQRIVVVTHSGVITQILGCLTGLRAARWSAFRVGHTSITELQWPGRPGYLARFDDRAHLNGEPAGASPPPRVE